MGVACARQMNGKKCQVVLVQPTWVPRRLQARLTQKEIHTSLGFILLLLTAGWSGS